MVKGEVKYKFVCKWFVLCTLFFLPYLTIWTRNPSQSLVHGWFEDSTKNLLDHACKCDPANTPQLQQLMAFMSSSTYSTAQFQYLLAMWCVRHHRPFNIVKDNELNEIFHMLYVHAEVPHPITVSRDIMDIFRVCKKNVVDVLQVWFSFNFVSCSNNPTGSS